MKPAAVFDDIYRDYVNQVAALNLANIKDRLGIEIKGRTARICLYGKWFEVSPDGIEDDQGKRPSHAVSVLLSKYLLLCPDKEPVGDDWVTYRNFKDAAPYVTGFFNTAEKPIASHFAERLPHLKKAAAPMTGKPARVEVSCDLALNFDALPKMPVLLLFNDKDEDFPAECSVLLKSNAERYLDMECLALLGWILADWLKRNDNSA